MWYTVSFIAGAFLGVITMSVLAASSMGDLEWEREQLLENLNEQEKELERNRDRLQMALSTDGENDTNGRTAEVSL